MTKGCFWLANTPRTHQSFGDNMGKSPLAELCCAMQKHPITQQTRLLLWLQIPLMLWDYGDIEMQGVQPLLQSLLIYLVAQVLLTPLLAFLETCREMRSCAKQPNVQSSGTRDQKR